MSFEVGLWLRGKRSSRNSHVDGSIPEYCVQTQSVQSLRTPEVFLTESIRTRDPSDLDSLLKMTSTKYRPPEFRHTAESRRAALGGNRRKLRLLFKPLAHMLTASLSTQLVKQSSTNQKLVV